MVAERITDHAPAARLVLYQGGGETNEDLFARFIDSLDRKGTTQKGYRTCIKHFGDYLGARSVLHISREDVKLYRESLANSGLLPGTRAQYLRIVKHFYKWAAAEGLCSNIAEEVNNLKIRRDIHKKDALQREDVPKIAASIDRTNEKGARLYAMYLLCVICGLRTIEINRANVEDLKTIAGDTYLYIQGKGHDEKDAAVLLIPEVERAIREYMAMRTDGAPAKTPLFISTSNRHAKDKNGSPDLRIATTTISTMLKTLMKNAGYDSNRLTAHSLRHTSGTGAHMAGLDLYGVQHLMRHCDPKTSEIYIHDENNKRAEKRGRQSIYNYYFGGGKEYPLLPELEKELTALNEEEQREILQIIKERREKGN